MCGYVIVVTTVKGYYISWLSVNLLCATMVLQLSLHGIICLLGTIFSCISSSQVDMYENNMWISMWKECSCLYQLYFFLKIRFMWNLLIYVEYTKTILNVLWDAIFTCCILSATVERFSYSLYIRLTTSYYSVSHNAFRMCYVSAVR